MPAIVCSSGTRIGDENHLGFADTGRPLRVVDGSPVTSFFSWFSVLYRRWFRKIGSDLIWVSGVVSERVPKLEKERPDREKDVGLFFSLWIGFFFATCHSSILKEGFKLGGTQKPYSHKPFSAQSISQWQLILSYMYVQVQLLLPPTLLHCSVENVECLMFQLS